jgi:hypothetical protein
MTIAAVRQERGARELVSDLCVSRARVVVGSSGAISSSLCFGLTVTKTAEQDGCYTVQAVDADGVACPLTNVMAITPGIISPTAAGTPITTGAGVVAVARSLSEADGSFKVQFVSPLTDDTDSTYVDADLESGSIFTVEVVSIRNEVIP